MVDKKGEYCVACDPRVEESAKPVESAADIKQEPALAAPANGKMSLNIVTAALPPQPATAPPSQRPELPRPSIAKRASKKAEDEFTPLYYRIGDLDVIDILRTKLPRDEYIGFLRGKVIQCVLRAGFKTTGVEIIDYKKAHWYMDCLIRFLEAEGGDEGK